MPGIFRRKALLINLYAAGLGPDEDNLEAAKWAHIYLTNPQTVEFGRADSSRGRAWRNYRPVWMRKAGFWAKSARAFGFRFIAKTGNC